MTDAPIVPSRPRIDGTPAGSRDPAGRARRAALARKASTRRRGIDPTTFDREYSAAELEFMAAMQAYKASSGRMFPTWSEALEVLQGLGYEKVAAEPDHPSRADAGGAC